MWDFRCPQLAGWAVSLLPEQPNCQGNQTAPTLNCAAISKNSTLGLFRRAKTAILGAGSFFFIQNSTIKTQKCFNDK